MNQILLTHCTIVDFPKVLPMLENYSDVFDYSFRRQVIQTGQKVLDDEPQASTLFIAEHESSTIGFLGFQISSENPGEFELFGQVVKRGYQGQGIGTKMLEFAARQSVPLGAQLFRVYLKANFPPQTRHFYQRRGFKPSFDDNYRGASAEDILLVRQLDRTVVTSPPTPAAASASSLIQ